MNKAEECLRYLVGLIAEDKEAIKITPSNDEMGILLTLHVAKSDMGRIIGKDGETAKAIRTILRSFGFTEGLRISLKIEEPE